ncbi:MAG TPA: chloride channel protein, partial [Anaerolineales bacterium]|nr:chloride channel protein [Anaerolineales bacterium]
VVKMLSWAIALGSGTSGGVLAPLLIIGGALGALEAHWLPVGDVSLWVMLSMGAMMGGTMRSPFTALVFVLELTHDLNVLPGLLIACVAADAVTILLMRRSILTEKVALHGYHLTREYGVDPLELIRVGEVMDEHPELVPGTLSLDTFADQFLFGLKVPRHQAFLVVDEQTRLQGILTRNDVVRRMKKGRNMRIPVEKACTRDLAVTYPDELLARAAIKMLERRVGRLPVVSREDPSRVVGYLGRSAVIEARLRQLNEESIRERGWTVQAVDDR